MAIVARPACASEDATSHGAPFLLSPNPWPKIAVGQPPAGGTPAGRKSVNWISLVDCGTGVPSFVPVAGITSAAFSYFGDAYDPNAIAPTEPGKIASAGVGRNEVVNVIVPVCRRS